MPSANDAATALAAHAGDGSVSSLRGVDERKGQRARAPIDALREPARARSAQPLLERPGHGRVASRRGRVPFIRHWAGQSTATIAGGRVVHTHRRSARRGSRVSSRPRRATRATPAGRRSRSSGAAVWRSWLPCSGRRPRGSETAISRLCFAGVCRSTPRCRRSTRRAPTRRSRSGGVGSRVKLVPTRSVRYVARVGRPLLERVVAIGTAALPVRRGQRARRSARIRRRASRRHASRSSPYAIGGRRQDLPAKAWWTARRTVHHLIGFAT